MGGRFGEHEVATVSGGVENHNLIEINKSFDKLCTSSRYKFQSIAPRSYGNAINLSSTKDNFHYYHHHHYHYYYYYYYYYYHHLYYYHY